MSLSNHWYTSNTLRKHGHVINCNFFTAVKTIIFRCKIVFVFLFLLKTLTVGRGCQARGTNGCKVKAGVTDEFLTFCLPRRQTLVWNSDTLQPFFLFIIWGIVGRHNVRHVDLLTFAVASF